MDHFPGKRPAIKTCQVCSSARIYYLFSTCDCRVVQCDDCGLVFLNPQPSDEELARIYGADYFLGSDTATGREAVSEIKQATARLYLAETSRYSGLKKGRLLEIGCGDGDFLVAAESGGWQVTGVEYSPAACEKVRRRLKNGAIYSGEIAPGQIIGGTV